MSLRDTGWNWLHLWSRHSCLAPRVSLAPTTPQSWVAPVHLPVQTCWAADRWHMTHGGLCLKAGAQPHLGTWESRRGGW